MKAEEETTSSAPVPSSEEDDTKEDVFVEDFPAPQPVEVSNVPVAEGVSDSASSTSPIRTDEAADADKATEQIRM